MLLVSFPTAGNLGEFPGKATETDKENIFLQRVKEERRGSFCSSEWS